MKIAIVGQQDFGKAVLEAFLARESGARIDKFNLSDIFEYMSDANSERLLRSLIELARPGARFRAFAKSAGWRSHLCGHACL